MKAIVYKMLFTSTLNKLLLQVFIRKSVMRACARVAVDSHECNSMLPHPLCRKSGDLKSDQNHGFMVSFKCMLSLLGERQYLHATEIIDL